MAAYTPSPLAELLGKTASSANMLAHAQHLAQLNQVFSQFLPEYLVNTSEVANDKNGMIVIHSRNGTTASRLRQMTTTLTRAFQQAGITCHGIQIKVSLPRHSAPVSQAASIKPISESTRSKLLELSASLNDEALNKTIQHLIDRAKIE